MKKAELAFEALLFRSRWILAPFYLGLVLAMLILLVKFAQELLHMLPRIISDSESDTILSILTMVDISLVANLLLIIIFSGYENFVSKITTGDHEDRPAWMGKISFSDLKIKVIGSIVAISAIELLKAFLNVKELTNEHLAWKVGIHITFVVSGLLFAIMDRVSEKRPG